MKPANSRTQKVKDRQKGAVAVEFAMMLPLLGILLLGVMEVGSIVLDYTVLKNAAREGARFSANPANQISLSQNSSTTLQTIQNRVVAYLQNENITVSAEHVTVSYTRPLIFPGVTSLIPSLGTLQISDDAVFRNFY